MSDGSCQSTQPTLCGCCEGIATDTPELVTNRPGLNAIAYRVGTHNSFLASLIAALSSSEIPPWAPLGANISDPAMVNFNPAVALAPLRTRDSSDFSIALLDCWATTLDILTFYQERIANELFLRTAVDAASITDLAQLVGYQPSPGVAASCYLAFTLSNAPGSPDNVLISAGTRVQSVPGPGQQPQVFETSSDITALIELNAIPPVTTSPWALNFGMTSIWIEGVQNNVNAGDVILFVNEAFYKHAATGTAAEFHYVTAVTVDSASGNTLIQWDTGLRWTTANDRNAFLYVFRKKAALFGVQAPDPRTLSTHGNNIGHLTGYPTGGNGDWTFQHKSGKVSLDASYPGTNPEGGQPAWTLLITPDFSGVFQIKSAAEVGPLLYTLTTKTTQLTVLSNHFQISPASPAYSANNLLEKIIGETRSATAYIQSNQLTIADPPLLAGNSYEGLPCQAGLLTPVAGTTLELITTQQLAPNQPVAIAGKRLRLQVAGSFSAAADIEAGFAPGNSTGFLPLAPGQEFLIDAYPPNAISGSSDMLWNVITTDGVAGLLTIANKYVVLTPSAPGDTPAGETALLSGPPTQDGPIVSLTFQKALTRIYDLATVTVNANTVAATNGETMYQILGSGDATNPALSFPLQQSPLTYISSPSNNGAVSTLQVWVNNIEWQQVNNFLDSGAEDRVYTTEADSKGTVTVEFGDGQQGELTPTGQMNIRAVYRKGIGSGGNVNSGQLSQAIDRPQGLKSVTNPDPATGGADPATASQARVSAPLNVLTLGRVVSLEDYQNFALAFAGIAKALATWTWVNGRRSVFLTVAGDNGEAYQSTDAILGNLISALQDSGNPYVPIYIPSPSYEAIQFEVGANIQVESDYDPTLVQAQVWQALATAFGFDQRSMGQGVAQSEVIAVIQGVPGVIAAEMTIFNVQGTAPVSPLKTVLLAASPAAGTQGEPKGAQLLTIDPASQGNLAVTS